MKRTKRTNLSKPKPVPQLPLVEYNIVHSIGDRFRLKIPLLQQDEFYSSNLEKLILSSPIITDYRFNLDASSLVVSYSNENTNKQDFLNYLDHIIRNNFLYFLYFYQQLFFLLFDMLLLILINLKIIK